MRSHILMVVGDDEHLDVNILDHVFQRWNPYKIALFVTAEEEDMQRSIYEKIYHKYNDTLTLYSGDIKMLMDSYTQKMKSDEIYLLQKCLHS